ncbi:MAG: universal stress protein [Actinomycetota bacterium]
MKILYATDGSPASDAAAALLESVGNKAGVELSVVAVVEPEPQLPEAYAVEAQVLEEAGARAREAVHQTTDRLTAAGFSAQGEVLSGWPGSAILHAAKDDEQDLVVVGAGRHSWLGSLLLGSTSMHILHSSPVSVVLVHESPAESRPVRILLATDGSPSARRAVALLSGFADPQQCAVTVLSVARIPYAAAAGPPYAPMAGVGSALIDELREKARLRVNEAADELERMGFQTETVATEGSPHHLIVEEADKGGYDLVVVGSRGHGALSRSLVGSVSDAVARNARAVLIARP